MSDILYFMNERMIVLMVTKDSKLEINNKFVRQLNQQEIIKRVPCSKQKVNQTIKELISDRYIEMFRSKGRYHITSKARKLSKIYLK